MKKIFILLFSLSLLISCSKKEYALLKGEFIYYNDAAVLQIDNTIYGVIINDKMHELNTMGKPLRAEPTDGILVEIKGEIILKAEGVDGWPSNIDIKEIINVKKLDPKQRTVVKIGQ